MGLSENSNADVKIENESGKSSQFGSLICPILTHLRHDRLAKLVAAEFSDIPNMALSENSNPHVKVGECRGWKSRNSGVSVRRVYRRERTRTRVVLRLSENSFPYIKIESESGKSSQILSLVVYILTLFLMRSDCQVRRLRVFRHPRFPRVYGTESARTGTLIQFSALQFSACGDRKARCSPYSNLIGVSFLSRRETSGRGTDWPIIPPKMDVSRIRIRRNRRFPRASPSRRAARLEPASENRFR